MARSLCSLPALSARGSPIRSSLSSISNSDPCAKASARLPIFAAAGAILFYFLSVLWNSAVERDHPKWRLRSAKPLAGVAEPAPLDISTRAFLSGALQKSASTALGRSLWVFPFSVRAKNQLLFSLFGVSGAPEHRDRPRRTIVRALLYR